MGHGAVMQTALMGMALGPGPLLSVHIGGLTLIGLSLPLRDHRLVAMGLQLARPHPGGVISGGAGRGCGTHGSDPAHELIL